MFRYFTIKSVTMFFRGIESMCVSNDNEAPGASVYSFSPVYLSSSPKLGVDLILPSSYRRKSLLVFSNCNQGNIFSIACWKVFCKNFSLIYLFSNNLSPILQKQCNNLSDVFSIVLDSQWNSCDMYLIDTAPFTGHFISRLYRHVIQAMS